jgi:hypothetical protein
MKLKTYFLYQNIFLLILFLAIILNTLPVLNNDCRMPVLTQYAIDDTTHFSFENNHEVNYPYFSDIFRINNVYFSIGDLFFLIGGLGFITIMLYLTKKVRYLKHGGVWE